MCLLAGKWLSDLTLKISSNFSSFFIYTKGDKKRIEKLKRVIVITLAFSAIMLVSSCAAYQVSEDFGQGRSR